jgi:hypothetical protein
MVGLGALTLRVYLVYAMGLGSALTVIRAFAHWLFCSAALHSSKVVCRIIEFDTLALLAGSCARVQWSYGYYAAASLFDRRLRRVGKRGCY